MKTPWKTTMSAVLVLCSCTSQKDISVRYDEIGGADSLLGNVRSACELAIPATMAGRFQVSNITGTYEELASGSWEPRTYVELKLIESWGGNAEDVTVRIAGGPLPNGDTVTQFISLKQGETVALVLEDAPDWNAGFRFLDLEQLFKEEGDQLSNGYVSGSRTQLAELFGTAIDRGECPTDIEPSDNTHTSEPDRPSQADAPEDGTEVLVNE